MRRAIDNDAARLDPVCNTVRPVYVRGENVGLQP
jgi:hypothetical protein